MAKTLASLSIVFTLLMMFALVNSSFNAEDIKPESEMPLAGGDDESWSEWAKHKLMGGEKAVSDAFHSMGGGSQEAKDKAEDAAEKAKGKMEDAGAATRRQVSEVARKAAKKKNEAMKKASMSFESSTNSKGPDSISVEGKGTSSINVEGKGTSSINVEGRSPSN